MKILIYFITLFIFSTFAFACDNKNSDINFNKENNMNNDNMPNNPQYAYFSSGCFWGVEYWFEKAEGVFSAISGYAGGHKANPTYIEVCTGLTGHLETVKVGYDADKTTYEDLIKLFFETHNFTQKTDRDRTLALNIYQQFFIKTKKKKRLPKSILIF